MKKKFHLPGAREELGSQMGVFGARENLTLRIA